MSHEVQGKPGSGISGELGTSTADAPPPGQRRQLRRWARARRRALGPAAQRAHSLAAARHLVASGLLHGSRRVALYMAADGEMDPAPLLAHLHQTGATVALPRLERQRGRMALALHHPDAPLVSNRYGLLEPLPDAPAVPAWTLTAAVLPLVAFDAHGNRLGMGAGYYDRLFGRPTLPRVPRLIGLAHRCQQVEYLPSAAWDVPLDAVVTEHGVLRCR